MKGDGDGTNETVVRKMLPAREVKSLSHVRLLATSRTTSYQGPLSMGLSRQEYWSGLPFPSPMHRKAPHKQELSFMLHRSKQGNTASSSQPSENHLLQLKKGKVLGKAQNVDSTQPQCQAQH